MSVMHLNKENPLKRESVTTDSFYYLHKHDLD